MVDMGYEYTDVKDFIEDKGVPELNQGILVSGLSEQHRYNNKLYTPNPRPVGNMSNQLHMPSQSIDYGYHDPNF